MKRGILRALVTAAVFSAMMTACAVITAADVVNYDVEVNYGQSQAREMLQLINEFRTGDDAWAWNSDNTQKVYYNNLKPLTYDYELEKAAMIRAAEIGLFFSHTRPNGSSCFSAGGWGTSSDIYGNTCGENIAAGYSSTEGTFLQWREDNDSYSGQGHRRNMLSSGFTTIGIGHVSYNGTHFWVQEFGNASHSGSANPDGATVVTISVESDYITESSLGGASVSKVSVVYGKKKALPTVSGYIYLDDGYYSQTWPGSAPVRVTPSWSSANTAYATVSGGYVTGKKAGSTSLIASWQGNKLTLPLTVTPLDLSAAAVTAGNATFSGTAKKPAANVVLNGTTLEKGTDYTTSWSNNVHAGTGTVTVTGTGNYKGSASGTFVINPLNLKSAGYTVAPISTQYYTGSAVKPAVSLLTSDGSASPAVSGTDFKVSYKNIVQPGTGTVTVTGQGDYKGTLTGSFTIRYRKVGTTMTVSGGVYKITKEGPSGTAEVSFTKASGTTTSIAIPAKVTWKGVDYYVTAIESNACKGNTALTSVGIGSRVKTIGAYAFMGCTKLSSVTIGNGVTKIGAYAFKNCTKLKKVIIGTGVTAIARHAFYNCKAITAMTFKGTKIKQANVAEDAFYGIGSAAVVSVPAEKLTVYRYIFRLYGGSKGATFKAIA